METGSRSFTDRKDDDVMSVFREQSADDTISMKTRPKKAPEIPQIERRNWLIHLHYIRGEYDKCKQLITTQLNETQGVCEFALFTHGLILRQEGKLQASLELFQSCAVLNPRNVENVKQVARSLFLNGKVDAAVETFRGVSEIAPNSWEVWNCLGDCYKTTRNYKKAKECFEKALDVSKREETFLQLGQVFTTEKDYEGAKAIYVRALHTFPENVEIHISLGLLFLTLSSYRKAFEHIGTALAFEPNNERALMAAGTVLQINGDFDVALSKYRPIACTAPDLAPLWNNIGMCFFGRKKYVACIGCLKRAQYLAPLDWIISYNLGLVHLTMQQYTSAFHFLSAVINLKPTAGNVFGLLAVALTYLQDLENARLAYEQAVELDVTDPTVCLNFAVFLYNFGESQLSSQQLQNYESRVARFGTSSNNVPIDQEHLDLANSLSRAIHFNTAGRNSLEPTTAPPT